MAKKKPKTFKELRNYWYALLAESGFEDAEDVDSPHEYLKAWHSHSFAASYSPEAFLAKKIHYEWASDALNWFKFHSPRDKKMWEFYAAGKTYLEISTLLKGELGKPGVFKAIKRIEREIKEAENVTNQTSE